MRAVIIRPALYRVGELVVTKRAVKVTDNRNRPAGYASPGWRWLVRKAEWVESTGRWEYVVEAGITRRGAMYSMRLRERQIDRVVG